MKDLTEGKLEAAKIFAKSIGTHSLDIAIRHLEHNDRLYFQETIITNDFAPHSFYFERTSLKRHEFAGNGGIIFHDISNGVGTSGAPSFSVSVENNVTKHWEIHT
jgi:hypothetical protein